MNTSFLHMLVPSLYLTKCSVNVNIGEISGTTLAGMKLDRWILSINQTFRPQSQLIGRRHRLWTVIHTTHSDAHWRHGTSDRRGTI